MRAWCPENAVFQSKQAIEHLSGWFWKTKKERHRPRESVGVFVDRMMCCLELDAAECAGAFAEDEQEGIDVARVKDACVVVEVDVVARCGYRDAGAFAIDGEEGVDVLRIEERGVVVEVDRAAFGAGD